MANNSIPGLMTRLSFSSEQMPAHLTPNQRASLWLDAISNSSIKLDIDCPDRDNFYGICDTTIIGSLVITKAEANSVRLQREGKHIARDNNDSLLLLVHNGGGAVGGTQFGRDVALKNGGAALFDNKEKQVTQTRDGGVALALYIPREPLERLGIDIEGQMAKVLDPNYEAVRLLVGYLQVLAAGPPISTPEIASLTGAHIADLMALSLDPDTDVLQLAKSRGLRAVRLSALRQAILNNAARPDLTAETLSRILGLSPRYLQQLLYTEGATLTEELTARRLDIACRILRDPEQKTRPIADIAFQSGFGDLSTFYRAFKKRCGASPGEFRVR